MVPSGIPNSLAALAPPISLASLTAWILYSWSYLRWVRDIESSSLFSFIIHEFLENKVSTLFIQHHNYTESLFESIRHVNKYGQEFWYARDLQIALEYTEWRNFCKVIEKAKEACRGSNNAVSDHFVDVNKIVNAGATSKDIGDIQLSRYACYLIVQNGDPRKKVIALGQTYFAVKTRQQELIENYENLSEDQKRIAIRQEMKEHNKMLVAAAKDAGVETTLDYAIFQNYGYMGLYGGLKASDIKERKGLKKSQDILDYMGYEELAANLFRATQTEAKLRRENIQGKQEANKTHFEVGKKVRDTIKDLGGTMPEDLPTPEKSIQQLEREQKKKLK
ncbi:MAG: DNA damage-inducible protein D [Clostridium sp.]|nr:DNA damage-inducible protein D [Clostridium sp.]RHP38122.1 DNA damage-inducible protein D [Clostridium sp. AF34-10BH]